MRILACLLIIYSFVIGVAACGAACDATYEEPPFEKNSNGDNNNRSNAGQGETGSSGLGGTNGEAVIENTGGVEGNAEEAGSNRGGTNVKGGEGGFGESGTNVRGGEGGFGENGTSARGGSGGFGESGAGAEGGRGGTGGIAADGGVDVGEIDCSDQPCYDFIECMAIGIFGCGFTECVYLHPDTPFPFLGMCK